jgi:hypothetical protein
MIFRKDCSAGCTLHSVPPLVPKVTPDGVASVLKEMMGKNSRYRTYSLRKQLLV